MAEWKKVVVSGSSAELSALTLDTALVGGSGGTGLLQAALTAGTAGQVLALNGAKTAFELADASTGDITGIDAGTGIVVTDGASSTPEVSVTTAISTGAAAGATANQDSTATILGGNLTGQVDGTAVATIKAGAAAGATANQDSTATILSGDLTGDVTGNVNGVAAATVTAGAAAGATANQDSTATILGGNLTGQVDGTAVATIKAGAAAGATANQDSNATILGGNLTGQVNGVAVATVTAGAAAGATANQDSNATILAGNLTGTVDGTAVATIKAGAAAGATANQDSTATILANSSLTGTTSAAALNVTGDTVIAGDLTVQGTASFESTENLLVKDRFIGLASGSAGAADGGIVIEQSNVDGGKGAVFAFDGLSTGRWGVDLDFNPTASAYTPAAFMSNVVVGSDDTVPTGTYAKKGNIFIGSSENEIWIYGS
tara:strand:+ start:5673 stop:6974 length:1302 start_codon:yes stop_codon:yes gene_type:complete